MRQQAAKVVRLGPGARVCAGKWLHGEAVAAGTVMAADLSLRLGWIDQDLFDRVLGILKAAKLPVSPPEVRHVLPHVHSLAVQRVEIAAGISCTRRWSVLSMCAIAGCCCIKVPGQRCATEPFTGTAQLG